MSDASGQELMAWLQAAFRAQDRVRLQQLAIGDVADSERPHFRYGVSTSDNTIDLDYQMDEWTVSLIRIYARPNGKLEIKRFAGPRSEAFDEANEWRESLSADA